MQLPTRERQRLRRFISSLHISQISVDFEDRREKPERVVDTRRAPKNTRRHTVSMLRMFFKRNEVDAILNGFAVDRL